MSTLTFDLKDRTVLITGAATGIGRATALAFAAAQASVVIGGVDPRAETTARDIVLAGGKAVFQKTDVSDSAQMQALDVTAKHAVVGLTKVAAIDYAAMGIRVNAIAPGLVRTPMTERWLNDPALRERVLADSPIRSAAELEDIAGLVLFLASDQASIITGAIYPIDGARTAH